MSDRVLNPPLNFSTSFSRNCVYIIRLIHCSDNNLSNKLNFFRVNLFSGIVWMLRNSLLETGANARLVKSKRYYIISWNFGTSPKIYLGIIFWIFFSFKIWTDIGSVSTFEDQVLFLCMFSVRITNIPLTMLVVFEFRGFRKDYK